jgi:type II secretory pathway pseudopilin PulG
MIRSTSSKAGGYTIIELVVIMTILGILFAVLFIFIPDSQLRARDKEREADISTLRGRLEELYQDQGAYPSQVTLSTFTRFDPEVLKDPTGQTLVNNAQQTDEHAARTFTSPTKAGPQYTYTPYPTGCTNNCVGYILKSYIEQPSQKTPNPYIVSGLNNN